MLERKWDGGGGGTHYNHGRARRRFSPFEVEIFLSAELSRYARFVPKPAEAQREGEAEEKVRGGSGGGWRFHKHTVVKTRRKKKE